MGVAQHIASSLIGSTQAAHLCKAAVPLHQRLTLSQGITQVPGQLLQPVSCSQLHGSPAR